MPFGWCSRRAATTDRNEQPLTRLPRRSVAVRRRQCNWVRQCERNTEHRDGTATAESCFAIDGAELTPDKIGPENLRIVDVPWVMGHSDQLEVSSGKGQRLHRRVDHVIVAEFGEQVVEDLKNRSLRSAARFCRFIPPD